MQFHLADPVWRWIVKWNFTSSCCRELYFYADYYTTHEVFKRTAKITEIPESVLFHVALTETGDKVISEGRTNIEAVKA